MNPTIPNPTLSRTDQIRQLLRVHGPLSLQDIARHLGLQGDATLVRATVYDTLRKPVKYGQVLCEQGLYSLSPEFIAAGKSPRRARQPQTITRPTNVVASPYRTSFLVGSYTCPELRKEPPRGQASLAPYRLPSRGLSV